MQTGTQTETGNSIRAILRRLTDMAERLDEAAAGEIIEGQEIRHEPGAEPMLPGELGACFRGRLLMVERALLASMQAVADGRPQLGDECVLAQVVRVCGWGAEVEARETELQRRCTLN